MAGFLSVKSSYAPAHKLMGYIYEKLGETKKAIAAYKLSLGLDGNQKDVLLTGNTESVGILVGHYNVIIHTDSHGVDLKQIILFFRFKYFVGWIFICSSSALSGYCTVSTMLDGFLFFAIFSCLGRLPSPNFTCLCHA